MKSIATTSSSSSSFGKLDLGTWYSSPSQLGADGNDWYMFTMIGYHEGAMSRRNSNDQKYSFHLYFGI